ncbi:probable pectinesterase 66 [Phragmites australis]|uniref:probable pectinesterase 66 n=1 Tax=Phragmites australis TaxID=29695 RepID=UPI002D791FC0|nr:probable pectinesterase 66 [Phragmites australis]
MQPFCFSSPSSSLLLLVLRLSTSSLAWATVSKTITVDEQGRGDFRTVQSAVNSVPDGNREWIRIHVMAGSYWEKVAIPPRKCYILLEGDGASTTDISFDAHAHAGIDQLVPRHSNVSDSPTFLSATFTVLADNFVARNIAFKNVYNAVDKSNADQAVAALVGGDKSAFYGCAFHGFQDTLCDFVGRHYFRRCLVEGGVDFIFGYGQSIYEGCVLASNMPPGPQPGWVTAHARVDAGSPGGLVFKYGAVLGTGRIYLGRAWNRFATVVFYRTRMDDVVVPQGWQAWNAGPDESQVTFAEVGCAGPGSEMSRRVGWEKHLSGEEVKRFVDIEFVDDGWLSKQP